MELIKWLISFNLIVSKQCIVHSYDLLPYDHDNEMSNICKIYVNQSAKEKRAEQIKLLEKSHQSVRENNILTYFILCICLLIHIISRGFYNCPACLIFESFRVHSIHTYFYNEIYKSSFAMLLNVFVKSNNQLRNYLFCL